MRILRYEDPSGKIHYASQQQGGSYVRIEGDPYDGFQVTKEPAKVQRILAPVVPTMIWCIGQNYRRHADEVGMGVTEYPVVFAKGPNTAQHPGEPIRLPMSAKSGQVDYEGELVVVMGKRCKDVSCESALEYVAGYTCGNDVSARDWQLKMGSSQ